MGGRAVVSDDEEEMEPQDDEREQEEEGEDLEGGDVGGGDDDEDEDDEEGQDEFEDDGFIVENDEEEEPEEEDRDDAEERHKKKKKKKRESFVLDEDDYELLLDNNVSVPRKSMNESKKFKRLKKARGDAEEGYSGFYDDDDYSGTGKGGRTAEEHVKRSLFGDDDGPVEDIPEEDDQPEEEDADVGDDDDMADFIVDEEEIDKDGLPVRRKKVKKKKYRQAPGVSSSALQEAQEIFGDVEELLKMRQISLDKSGRYDDSGDFRERRLEDEFEPIILAERYMTDKDDRIREIDIPERMQISEESTGPPPTDADAIDEESKWIRKQLESGLVPVFVKMALSEQEREEMEDHIKNFLNFTHVQKLDVPYIAMYRKEDIFNLLKDPEAGDDVNRDKPALRWHKVN